MKKINDLPKKEGGRKKLPKKEIIDETWKKWLTIKGNNWRNLKINELP